MLQERDVEQIIYLVVRDVEFLQLLEGPDTLDLFKLASSDMEHSHILERGSNVHEIADDRVVQFEEFQTAQDFSYQLQVVECRIYSKF